MAGLKMAQVAAATVAAATVAAAHCPKRPLLQQLFLHQEIGVVSIATIRLVECRQLCELLPRGLVGDVIEIDGGRREGRLAMAMLSDQRLEWVLYNFRYIPFV